MHCEVFVNQFLFKGYEVLIIDGTWPFLSHRQMRGSQQGPNSSVGMVALEVCLQFAQVGIEISGGSVVFLSLNSIEWISVW